MTVPEQFVALPGGGGVVNKFRLSEHKKNTQDGPGPPQINKYLIRGGPGPSGVVHSTSVFGVTLALPPLQRASTHLFTWLWLTLVFLQPIRPLLSPCTLRSPKPIPFAKDATYSATTQSLAQLPPYVATCICAPKSRSTPLHSSFFLPDTAWHNSSLSLISGTCCSASGCHRTSTVATPSAPELLLQVRQARVPDHLIKILGRWTSDCYQGYIHTPKAHYSNGPSSTWVWWLPPNELHIIINNTYCVINYYNTYIAYPWVDLHAGMSLCTCCDSRTLRVLLGDDVLVTSLSYASTCICFTCILWHVTYGVLYCI